MSYPPPYPFFGSWWRTSNFSVEGSLANPTTRTRSAPAYFYRLMDSMVATGMSLGLPESLARDLITQSCIGSGAFAREIPGVSLAQLKNDVCVPGGSTEKAMNVLDAHGWHRGVKEAITASLTANRSMGQKVKGGS